MATYNLFNNKDFIPHQDFGEHNSNNRVLSICLKNGGITATLLIMSFIALCASSKLLNLNQLAGVHLFFLLMGVYFSLEEYSPTGKQGSIDYFEGFKVGLYSTLIAVFFHAVFVLAFTHFFPDIPEGTRSCFFLGFTSSITAAAITFFEELAAGIVLTFCLMQYFKKNDY